MARLAFSRLKIIILILGLTGHICCAAKISETPCSSDGECTVQDSVCDTVNSKCKCNTGFVEDTPGTACVSSSGQTHTTKISETPCSSNGECTVQDSVCDTVNSKCKCNTGFVEDTPGTACVSSGGQTHTTKISETPCSSNGECTVQDSVCDTVNSKCKCNTGFVEDTPGTACVSSGGQTHTTKISETPCSSNGECTVQDSVCDTVNSKCKCNTGFVEDTPGTACVSSSGQTLTKVDSTVCTAQGTECNSIGHAECDSTAHKCKCSDGFKMSADKCIAAEKNTGVSTTFAFVVLALPVILSIKEALM